MDRLYGTEEVRVETLLTWKQRPPPACLMASFPFFLVTARTSHPES